MRQFNFSLVMAGLILLLLMAVPVLAAPSVSSISPAAGYRDTTISVTIAGTGFDTNATPKVKLMMEDESNITGTVTTNTATSISCKFAISSTKELGKWDVVVVNPDGSEGQKSNAFTIRAAMTLSSITPDNARTNNNSAEVTIAGTGLSDVGGFYLYNRDYDNVSAMDVDAVSSTKVTGIFDLTDVEVDDYKVCIKDSFGTAVCGLTFEVLSDEVGIIDITSAPTGASVYVDSVYKGTTPMKVKDIDAGTHKVVLKKTGFGEWGKSIKVTADSTTTVDADLVEIVTATSTVPTTRIVITTATMPPTTVKSSKTIPTPWGTATPTPESPVGTGVIIGAVAVGIIVLSRR